MEIIVILLIFFLIGLALSKAKKKNKIDLSDEYIGQKKKSKKNAPNSSYATIRFKYKDREGNVTERTVDVITGKRGETFKAFCHMRKEERTFYFSRITGNEVIDVISGEVISPMEWRYRLQGTKVAKQAMEAEQKKHA